MMFRSAWVAALAATCSASSSFLEARQSNNLTTFIEAERNISLTGAIANIGGTNNSVIGNGPLPGVVVASPSLINPDYFYAWTRDTALVMLMLTDEMIFGTNTHGNNSIQLILEYYTNASAYVQTVTNPSGTFYPAGQGLGEPKFYTNLTRFDGTWGRPQNDGPALRASTFMELATLIYQRNPNATAIVRDIYWPLILNDLRFVGQYWNTTSYDLWEEVNGNSFFTTTAQFKALAQGAQWAARLNTTCAPCGQASEILCFLETQFWNTTGNYILANINANQVNRSQINCDPILAAMHVFDINANCSAAALQPCNNKVLATHKVWVDSFRNLYPINDNATAPAAVLTGRYPEDTYYDGNPWFITTLAAAEVLYDAVAQMKKIGSYQVDSINLAFFQDLMPNITTGNYSGSQLTAVANAVTTYADGFVELVQQYLPSNGSISEQINKTSGESISASALTWSFAAFVTAAERRDGQYPPSWGANSSVANAANATCRPSSYNSTFTYAPAVAAGAPRVPQTYSNASGCLTEVLFEFFVNTMYGDNPYMVGNTSVQGNSIGNASAVTLALLPGNITAGNPEWHTYLWFPAGEIVQYAYVLQGVNYNYTFENVTRTIRAPACGQGMLTVLDNASFPPK